MPILIERLYRSLYRIRRVEEEIAKVYPTDKIKSPIHLSIGQESVSVGVCEALSRMDVAFGSYRSHALYLAKGGDLRKMIAELYGKATGCASGKGGSMHLIDVKAGFMGASAVVGTTIPNAVGYAYAIMLRRDSRIVVSFFGDGAVEEGVFHESMNFAMLKKLPIIFICENNSYAIHAHQSRRQSLMNIAAKARVYGMPSEELGSDVLRIHERVSSAVAHMRSGGTGPFFFECFTYRFKEHVGPNEDYDFGYRTRLEAAPWIENDRITRQKLGELIDNGARRRIEADAEAEINDAFEFAEASPYPNSAELFTDVADE